MNPRTLVLAALWAGTVAAAWWFGHHTGTQNASTRVVATRESDEAAPGKPKTPGQGVAKSGSSAAGSGRPSWSPCRGTTSSWRRSPNGTAGPALT